MAQVIRSLKHPDAIKLLRLSTDKKLRYAWKKCLVSSPALIEELSRKFQFEDIILDKKPKTGLGLAHKNLYVVSPKLLEKVSQLKSARSGMLATLQIPAPISLESFDVRRLLILNGIDDLGELGTILRSASAFSWDGVWLTHTCGDPFDPVCIRASQGALFELPYRVGSIENALKHVRRSSEDMLKLKVDTSRRADVRLVLGGPIDLKESILKIPPSGDVCLLIQSEGVACPAVTDFKTVDVALLEHHGALPFSVRVSSILSAVRDRYF